MVGAPGPRGLVRARPTRKCVRTGHGPGRRSAGRPGDFPVRGTWGTGRVGPSPRRPDDRHTWHAGTDRNVRPRDRHGTKGLVPTLQRTASRVRPRRPADEGGAGRRRVGHQRTKSVDLGWPIRGSGHAVGPYRFQCAQACRNLLFRVRDAARWRRRATAQGDDRSRALQRGLPHRRSGSGFGAHRRGQQRMGGGEHDTDERAGRTGFWRRQRRRRRFGAARYSARGTGKAGGRLRRASGQQGHQRVADQPRMPAKTAVD